MLYSFIWFPNYLDKFEISLDRVWNRGVDVFEDSPLAASSQRLGFDKGIPTLSWLSILEALLPKIIPSFFHGTYFIK